MAANKPPKVNGLIGVANQLPPGVPLGKFTPPVHKSSSLYSKSEHAGGPRLLKLPLGLIDESPNQNRIVYDEGALDELGQTLERHQVEPIVVRATSDDRYELIAGHRRCRAARLRGMDELLALVYSDQDGRNEEQVAFDVLVSNEQRETLSDYERALGYQRRIAAGARQADIAQRLGVSPSLISMRLSFLKLPQPALEVLNVYPSAISRRYLPDILNAISMAPQLADDLAQGIVAMGTGEITQEAFVGAFCKRARTAKEALPGADMSPKASKATKDFAVVCAGRSVCSIRLPSSGKKDLVIRPATGVDSEVFAQAITDLLEKHKDDLDRAVRSEASTSHM